MRLSVGRPCWPGGTRLMSDSLRHLDIQDSMSTMVPMPVRVDAAAHEHRRDHSPAAQDWADDKPTETGRDHLLPSWTWATDAIAVPPLT